MKNIKKIFIDDVLSLVKNFFALVIVIGICFLPALYAWFNIYSNWDPYGNTGALKFAAVSLDKGYTDSDGEYYNQGDAIIENLKDNTSVDWQFVESSDEAINGVYSGEYYAAVVIDEDFSYDMYNVLTEEVSRPTLHFYENQKKNPVATKISDTVVQTLQNNINVAFTQVVVSRVFSSASQVSEEISEEKGINTVLDKITDLSNDLTNYQSTINQIIENDKELKSSLQSAKTDATALEGQAKKSANAVKNSANVSSDVNTSINSYSNDLNQALNLINSKISDLNSDVANASTSDNAITIASDIKDALIKAAELEKLIYSLPDEIGNEQIEQIKQDILTPLKAIQSVLQPLQGLSSNLDEQIAIINKSIQDIENIDGSIENNQQRIDNVNKRIEALQSIDVNVLADAGYDKLKDIAGDISTKSSSINQTVSGDLKNKINSGISSLTGVLTDSNKILNYVGETFGNLAVMFDSISNTVDSANTSLEKTNEALAYVNGRLIDVLDEVEAVGANDKLKVLVNALSGDPEAYGKFFSTPVEIETVAVYPVENYGSAVAPFYSTLAFWVGALILTAIIKIKPDRDKYPTASERQFYFGRYVLFWIVGQIQSVIIVLGDIYLLHVQCIHPWLFLLAGSVIATTFTILIYSLVVTWGDVGKAIAVVLVVIQIAGSSGTYPIELLPEFFKKIYIFFPFPYAINAIRECLCGTYELDYLKYLGSLFIFIGVSLVIGLLVRIPFAPINHYMEERMEDTEMM